MHSKPKENIIDEYKMTVGDMVLEVYQAPAFLLAEILTEFMVEATIRKSKAIQPEITSSAYTTRLAYP